MSTPVPPSGTKRIPRLFSQRASAVGARVLWTTAAGGAAAGAAWFRQAGGEREGFAAVGGTGRARAGKAGRMPGQAQPDRRARQREDRDQREPVRRPARARRTPGAQTPEVRCQVRGGAVAPGGTRIARAQEDGVEALQALGVGGAEAVRAEVAAHRREVEPVAAHARFVEHLAQAVEVGGDAARTFRRDVAFRADERALAVRGDEADVRQLGDAADEDDVVRLDVAVAQAVGVERAEGFGQGNAEGETLVHGQAAAVVQGGAQGARRVGDGVGEGAARGAVVGQFHDVVEETARVVPPDLEDVHEPGVRTADRLEGHHAVELAAEGAFAVEVVAPDDLDGAPGSRGDGAGEPDFAVGAAPDAAQHLVVGHDRARTLAAEVGGEGREERVGGGRRGGQAPGMLPEARRKEGQVVRKVALFSSAMKSCMIMPASRSMAATAFLRSALTRCLAR